MKLILIWLIVSMCFTEGISQSQSFFDHYRLFWTVRIKESQSQNSIKQDPNVRPLDAAEMKNRMRRVNELKQIFAIYEDSTQIDLTKSSTLFLLIFTDPRTGLERTYVWNEIHKLYFEEYLAKSLTGLGQLNVKLRNLPQFDKSMSVKIIMKEDSLKSLLEHRKLKTMTQFAYEHQLPGGETCLGIICFHSSQFARFTPIELPSFEYIQTSQK